jgi:hypothetical protein
VHRPLLLLSMASAACIDDNTVSTDGACYEGPDCMDDLKCVDCGVCAASEAVADCGDDEGGGYITCNDGTKSPSCTSCNSGCCSGHDGCS